VEDNMLAGGFGSAVAEYLTDKQADFKMLRLGVGDEFVEHAKSAQLYDKLHLSADEIAAEILRWKK
jgi:1-deoxy-D-xylulose-5-phosphate synthase